MKDFNEILETYKINVIEIGEDGAAFKFLFPTFNMFVIASFGDGWDHVSVSLNEKRCPTWDEMCFVKNIFFRPDEAAMQIHPSKEEYVNNHLHCLHLWRPQNEKFPLPTKYLV
jgi:hypothetical protein